MTIQRDPRIRFHELGTLRSVTMWLHSHEAGLAEWLKNVRRAYAQDRANVEPEHRVGVVLFRDGSVVPVGSDDGKARFAVLDVGGATLEDVLKWSTWQDPEASQRAGRASQVDEVTQGNGGKAYMYKMFNGPSTILGVKGDFRNCKGFEGPRDTEERGTPGFVPDEIRGKDVRITNWKDELNRVLQPYHVTFDSLPTSVKKALIARKSFTLVEGVEPVDYEVLSIPVEELMHKVLRHGQATRAVEEVKFFVIHNGQILYMGHPLKLDPIPAYEGFEEARVVPIPETLHTEAGMIVSTTVGGTFPPGRLTLRTSKANMAASRVLKYRWRITYRTSKQIAGTREVSAVAPATPASQYVYGDVELEALEGGWISLGRDRPVSGPLTEALDLFVEDQIRALAREINDARQVEFDREALDEVHAENQQLNRWKNKFLPSEFNAEGEEDEGDGGGGGSGGGGPRAYGKAATRIDIDHANETLKIGVGVSVSLRTLLSPKARDADGKTVRADIEWIVDRARIFNVVEDRATAGTKGTATVRARVAGTTVYSEPVTFDCWLVDYVLLTPRSMVVKVGERQLITAEVTNDEGKRASDVLLEWRHSAEDPLIVRIRQTGYVSGNRLGRTTVIAGAGDPVAGGKWSNIGVEVEVVANTEGPKGGKGTPQLLITGRDIDPSTGEVREGDPDSPALWQETVDFQHNIWWLNLQSADAAYAFGQRAGNAVAWRMFHAQKLVDMIAQVHMKVEYTEKGETEIRDFWASHKQMLDNVYVRLVPQMWESLKDYVATGTEPQ